MRKLLYLPIEIVERELDAKILLAIEGLMREYDVYIGHYMALPKVAQQLGHGFYLYKAMTDYRAEKLFKPLRDSGVSTGVLDEEGLIFPSLEYYVRTRIGKGESFQYLSKVFTWGRIQKDFISEKFNLDSRQIVETGNPRIDLLRPPYRQIFDCGAKEIRQKYGKFVLVNTNFGPGNYSPIFKFSYHEHMRYFGRIANDEEDQYYGERTAYYRNLFDSYVSLVKKLARSIYPVKVVIRPHPVEDHDHWREELKGIDNALVIFEGSAIHWIVASECLIHTGCTTGVEAFVLDKPVFRFNPSLRLDMESSLPNSLGEEFSDMDHFVNRIDDFLGGRSEYTRATAQEGLLNDWIENIGSEFASSKILNQIDSTALGESSCHTKGRVYFSLRDRASVAKRGVKRFLMRAPRIANMLLSEESIRSEKLLIQRFSGISRRKLEERLRLLGALRFEQETDIEVSQVARDVFRISRRRWSYEI